MKHMIRWMAVLAALVLVLGVAGRAQAAPAGKPSAIKGEETFKLEPGGKATITFESFCIDYGKKFPTAVGLPPTAVADSKVVGAINYALSKDYTTSAPKEVQFAIWQARGAQGSPATGAQGNEVTQNANMTMTAPAGATSVIDALKQNKIKATAGTWNGIGEKITISNETTNFQGKGELTIENTSQAALTLYMQNGTVFPAPSAEFQSMAGYATNVQVQNPQGLPVTGVTVLSPVQMLVFALLALNVLALGYVVRRRSEA